MSPGRPRVAVTGAGGLVGGALARALERHGAEVVRVVHHAIAPGAIAVDLVSRSASGDLRRAFAGCDAVVHAAAYVHRDADTERERALCHAVNVDGTARALDAAASTSVARFVFVSTIGVHGFHDSRARTEEDVPAPSTPYGATKWLAEQLVASAREARVVRLATVVGAGDTANYARLARAIAKGRFVVPGDGSARKSVLAIDDAAELLARTALTETLPHALFQLAHPRPVSVREICDTLAEGLGARPPSSVPLAPLRAASHAVDLLTRVVGRPTHVEDAIRKLTTDAVVSTARAEACFPGHAYRTLREVAPSYRANVIEASSGSRA